ncbi:hypothetical protein [Engelhardtia mirabilis]|uniref:Uncharacterized protein n=1 Tax=Engelhardtia mirabilis TaxID=2528011 RepID=A0A518BFK6_9BACT|nr:hypothetical protein Pla133_08300 [Planctomycetes bacterium Pla133]QDV00090.1 hypothetical protein Pla86_08290 [Planctomycetes bacterium Pla86]
MNQIALSLTLALAVSSASCVETVAVRQAQAPLPEVLVSTPRAAWRVVDEDSDVGFVLRFEATGDGRAFHSVRNVWNQELGLIDSEGRAWRYRPHSTEPDWLGTGPVNEGASRILGLAAAHLEPVSLDQVRGR